MIEFIKKFLLGKNEKSKVESKLKKLLKRQSADDTEYSMFSGNIIAGNHIKGDVIVSGGGKVVINGVEQKTKKQSLGPSISQHREVSSFNKIELSGVVNVFFEQADETSVVVNAEEKIIHQIITSVKDNTLHISIDGNLYSTKSINVTVKSPELTFVKQSGVTSFTAENLKSEFIKFKFKSTGKATLAGSVNTAEFNIDGVGTFDAKKLVTNAIKVDASGVGSVHLNAQETITGSLTGVGSRHIYGNPRNGGLKIGGVGSTNYH